MADKYSIKHTTLKGLADAVRSVNGTDETYTPEELIEEVATILESGLYLLVDEAGNEFPATFVEEEVVLTATENDIRLGTTAVTEEGVIEGSKEIPSYHTREGYKLVTDGSKFVLTIPAGGHDYTKLQAIFCPFDTSIDGSVAAERVAIEDHVYPVQSTVSESDVSIVSDPDGIDFGITNTSGKTYLIRYFTYKEIY